MEYIEKYNKTKISWEGMIMIKSEGKKQNERG